MEEEWHPIADRPGYQVSNLGRVVGKTDKILTQNINRKGYSTVALWAGDRNHTDRVHRLVATAFLGPMPDGLETCHLDGDKYNNRLDNLRYVSKRENVMHKLAHGTQAVGKHHPWAYKLTEEQVAKIREEFIVGHKEFGFAGLAKKYGVHAKTIEYIARYKIWKHNAPPADNHMDPRILESVIGRVRARVSHGDDPSSPAESIEDIQLAVLQLVDFGVPVPRAQRSIMPDPNETPPVRQAQDELREALEPAKVMILSDSLERASVIYGPLDHSYLCQEIGRRDLILRAALAALRTPPSADIDQAKTPELDAYDAGLLSDYGGGNVEWWQDYIRAELGRAHDFYASQWASLQEKA